MIRRLIVAAFLSSSKIAFCGNASFEPAEHEGSESFADDLESIATPFHLAHKYRFSACNARQGAMARAGWIVKTAYAADEISIEQHESDVFRNDVARLIRGLCSDRR